MATVNELNTRKHAALEARAAWIISGDDIDARNRYARATDRYLSAVRSTSWLRTVAHSLVS